MAEQQNFEAIIGRSARYSDHKVGETIAYQVAGHRRTGTIMHVRAPGPVYLGGPTHPTLYTVDAGLGFPDMVYQSEVLEA